MYVTSVLYNSSAKPYLAIDIGKDLVGSILKCGDSPPKTNHKGKPNDPLM